jgi:hypothetical protein
MEGIKMTTSEIVKPIGDVVAASITVGIFLKLISAIAGLFTIIWTAMRLYEMVTGKPFHKTKLAAWLRRDKE